MVVPRLKHIIILQNKIDLVNGTHATEQHESILKFVQSTVAEGAPIVPISAQLQYNVEVICEYIVNKIPIPLRDFTSSPRLIVIRSFDVNTPGSEVDDLKGGVAGGSILRGVLQSGQEIEVRPGVVSKDDDGKLRCTPIFFQDHLAVRRTERPAIRRPRRTHWYVPMPPRVPLLLPLAWMLGRLPRITPAHSSATFSPFPPFAPSWTGVGTIIDPTLCRADRLVGQVLGSVGGLPDIYTELEINFFLLRRLLGVKSVGTARRERRSRSCRRTRCSWSTLARARPVAV